MVLMGGVELLLPGVNPGYGPNCAKKLFIPHRSRDRTVVEDRVDGIGAEGNLWLVAK